jgi:hypothetical protein
MLSPAEKERGISQCVINHRRRSVPHKPLIAKVSGIFMP